MEVDNVFRQSLNIKKGECVIKSLQRTTDADFRTHTKYWWLWLYKHEYLQEYLRHILLYSNFQTSFSMQWWLQFSYSYFQTIKQKRNISFTWLWIYLLWYVKSFAWIFLVMISGLICRLNNVKTKTTEGTSKWGNKVLKVVFNEENMTNKLTATMNVEGNKDDYEAVWIPIQKVDTNHYCKCLQFTSVRYNLTDKTDTLIDCILLVVDDCSLKNCSWCIIFVHPPFPFDTKD